MGKIVSLRSVDSRSFDENLIKQFSRAPFFLGTPFSGEDRIIINNFVAAVPMLASLFGSQCEVIVHSLEDPSHAVVAVEHGRLSGRKVGDPIFIDGLEALQQRLKNRNAYFCFGHDGQRLKAGISPIVNSSGRCIGCIGLALNLDAPLLDVCSILQQEYQPDNDKMIMWGGATLKLENIIEETCSRISTRNGVSSRSRARLIIAELYKMGVFNYRNAVALVSRYTGISAVTVYWHLRELKKEEAD